ncbi:MAG TPA: CHY zinc finger protein [Enterococcus sp.]|nr:CHY zinc finger protein [Enterococcus sp.]
MIIYGIEIDGNGRCLHYHQENNIVGLKCNKCKKYYACYQCHNTYESHTFEPIAVSDTAPVICGHCHTTLTFFQYKKGACPYCQAKFNPNCQLHETIYFSED